MSDLELDGVTVDHFGHQGAAAGCLAAPAVGVGALAPSPRLAGALWLLLGVGAVRGLLGFLAAACDQRRSSSGEYRTSASLGGHGVPDCAPVLLLVEDLIIA